MHGYRIVGKQRDLETYLDVVHVHCDVAGIEERDGEIHAWLASGTLPPTHLQVSSLHVPDAIDWRRDDAIIRIASDLIVRPPWIVPPLNFAGVDLVVPRGMAFGSGEHESTKLALRLLHTTLDAPGSFADVGTGSGILALYATHRGCAPLAACDIEEAAAEAARSLLPQANVLLGGAEALAADGPYDHVVANMTGEELLTSAAAIRRLWNGHGCFVVSGMRHHEVDRVRAAMQANGTNSIAGDDFVAWAETPRSRRHA